MRKTFRYICMTIALAANVNVAQSQSDLVCPTGLMSGEMTGVIIRIIDRDDYVHVWYVLRDASGSDFCGGVNITDDPNRNRLLTLSLILGIPVAVSANPENGNITGAQLGK